MDETNDCEVVIRSDNREDELPMSAEAICREISLVEAFLRSALRPTNVEKRRFPARWVTRDEVINTNRWILVLAGRIEYAVEGVRTRVEEGEWILVPNWVRRQWRVRGRAGCELIWSEFAAECGYHDPLFFTRQYGKFWGHSPRADRVE